MQLIACPGLREVEQEGREKVGPQVASITPQTSPRPRTAATSAPMPIARFAYPASSWNPGRSWCQPIRT